MEKAGGYRRVALARREAAHVLGVERVGERKDGRGGVEVVGVPEPELPVLVLAPRVHLPRPPPC